MVVAGEALERLCRFGRVHLLGAVSSTNDHAFSIASSHEPAVIVARTQTKGRGRFQREWFSDESSLIATYLLFSDAPGFPHPSMLTHLAGLALCETVHELAGLAATVRWPNDLMYGDKKLAGILCEARRSAVAVGLGLNVNQAAFPAELTEAGSLRLATGREWDPLTLLADFLTRFATYIEAAGSGETAALIARLKAHSEVIHRRVEVRTLLRRQVGTAVDISADGRLVLRCDSGKLTTIDAGDVRRLR
jgi:BirA family biotin operon repressor/biotin-[acetyl-CoA-carboxylase] ligase